MSNLNQTAIHAMAPDTSGTSAQPGARIKVWDPFVRLFHWSLVVAVLTAYFTEDDLLGLHTWAGYTVLALIGARLLWGLVGPHHARWSSFVRGPRATLAYLADALRGQAARHLGHNPAGAVMVLALLTGTIRGILYEPDGEVLRYGRGRRLFSPAQARLIRALFRRCCHPWGCDRTGPATQTDHTVEHQDGGPTDVVNGKRYCEAHNLWKTNHRGEPPPGGAPPPDRAQRRTPRAA